jgi:hypothetical protein
MRAAPSGKCLRHGNFDDTCCFVTSSVNLGRLSARFGLDIVARIRRSEERKLDDLANCRHSISAYEHYRENFRSANHTRLLIKNFRETVVQDISRAFSTALLIGRGRALGGSTRYRIEDALVLTLESRSRTTAAIHTAMSVALER